MKQLYDSLRGCAKEEEVKAEFCKFFRMKIFAQRAKLLPQIYSLGFLNPDVEYFV
jgi:hypothetical protein